MTIDVATGFRLAPIKDDQRFECLCKDLWRNELNDPGISRHGRPGQKQDGVDIFGRPNGNGLSWTGIQCKAQADGTLTEAEILTEVEKAKAFNPRLSCYIVATTCKRDVKVQEFVRHLNDRHTASSLFSVQIRFWEDIEELLSHETNLLVLRRYYKDFFITQVEAGYSVAKLFRLDVGYGSTAISGFELMVGKTICPASDSDHSGINYYKDRCFLCDLASRKMGIFKFPPLHYDFTKVLPSPIDAYLVARWMREFSSIDDMLDQDQEECRFLVPKSEYVAFRDEICRGDEEED